MAAFAAWRTARAAYAAATGGAWPVGGDVERLSVERRARRRLFLEESGPES